MRIKKLRNIHSQEISLAMEKDHAWYLVKEMAGAEESIQDDLIAFLRYRENHVEKVNEMVEAAAAAADEEWEEVLLLRPLLYRDFMLCEKHVIGSTLGLVKVLMPDMYDKANAYFEAKGELPESMAPSPAYYANPVYYKGNNLSFQKSGTRVTFPSYAKLLDYELELGMIITKEIKNATEEEALEAIGAFVVFNDFSIRNVQVPEMKQTGFGPCKAKDFASAISNVAVTADEILPVLSELKTRVILNGEIRAEGQLHDFLFSLGQAVAYASLGETVYPGEFMGSGTITGCSGIETGNLLKPGDVLRLEIDRIGYVENVISLEA